METPFTTKDAIHLLTNTENQTNFFFSVFFPEQPDIVAVTVAHPNRQNNIEIGYWVSPFYQRQGIAYETVIALIQQLQKAYPDVHIIAECRPKN